MGGGAGTPDTLPMCTQIHEPPPPHTHTPYLAVLDGLPEEVVEEEAGQFGILVKSGLDVPEEDASDDAPPTPHEGNGPVVELPAVALGRFPEQHEALGIADDLGGIQGLRTV